MSISNSSPPVQRKKSRYRMVIMNEDSFEEVTQFRLTRLSVYLGISTLFVALITLTVSLIVFTPIKYYLPGAGYGNLQQLHELRQLKLKTDSLLAVNKKQEVFEEALLNVLRGNVKSVDTTRIQVEPVKVDPKVQLKADKKSSKDSKKSNDKKGKKK